MSPLHISTIENVVHKPFLLCSLKTEIENICTLGKSFHAGYFSNSVVA